MKLDQSEEKIKAVFKEAEELVQFIFEDVDIENVRVYASANLLLRAIQDAKLSLQIIP